MAKASKEEQRKAPILRFKGFTDDWEQRELGEIAKKRTEKNSSLLTNNVLSNSAIYGIVRQAEYFDKSIANNIQNYYLVHEDDFVYNPRISNNAPFGPISRNKLNELGVMSPLYLVFYFSIKSLSDYLEIYFKSSKWNKFMYMNGNSGARSDRFAIKDNDFFKMKIKIPHSKDEIDKIYKLNILLHKLLTSYERKVKLLSQVKKYFLNNLFAEKEYPNLRFKGFTDAWEQRQLSELTQQVKRTSNSENPILTISAKNGWMNQKDRFNRIIAGEELKNYIELYENELSYNHGNSKYAKFGIIYVQRKYEKALVPKVYHSFSMTFGDPRFIENLSIGHKLDKELSKLITSGARQDGLLNINKKSFYSIKLFVPSEQEQSKISNLIDILSRIITLYEDKQQHLTEIKKTLLNTMFI